jgi:sarcosine oxidase subunit gamma
MVTLRGDLASAPLRAAGGGRRGRGARAGAPFGDERAGRGLDVARRAPGVPAARGRRRRARAPVEALAGEHHLLLDVSDLRACVRLDGPGWREVLGKLSPADLHPDAFGPGMVRRSHLGPIAAAFWAEGQGARVLCFRSVADHALLLLRRSAADGAVRYF